MESGRGKQTLQFVVAPDSVLSEGQGAWQAGCSAWTAYREIHFESIHIKNKGRKTNEQTQCDSFR